MKKKWPFLFTITNFLAFAGFAISIPDELKVIYGEDDRVEVHESNIHGIRELSRSVALKVPNRRINFEYDGLMANITKGQMGPTKYMCLDEKFYYQQVPGNCTGFLVGEDLLLTAGHCARSNYDCGNNSWVFDYRIDYSDSNNSAYVLGENVYKCSEVLATEFEVDAYYMDFSLIRLERVVDNRSSLKLRESGKVDKKDELFVIGHPLGLPQKVADNGFIIDDSSELTFVTNLDSMMGNSGSPVINKSSGLVEGILVRGEEDFVWDEDCQRSRVCKTGECSGESVIRIITIGELFPQYKEHYDKVKSDLKKVYVKELEL